MDKKLIERVENLEQRVLVLEEENKRLKAEKSIEDFFSDRIEELRIEE